MLKWDNYMLGCVQVSSWSPLVDTPTHTHITETVTSSILHRAKRHTVQGVSASFLHYILYTLGSIMYVCIYICVVILTNKFDVLTRRNP